MYIATTLIRHWNLNCIFMNHLHLIHNQIFQTFIKHENKVPFRHMKRCKIVVFAQYFCVCGFCHKSQKNIAIMLSKIALYLDNICSCLKYIEIPRHRTTTLLTETWPMGNLELRRQQRINDFPLFMHICDECEGGTLVCGLMSHKI